MPKLLIEANCPVNEYWEATCLVVTIKKGDVEKLLACREATARFLKDTDSEAYGCAELHCPFGLETISSYGDLLTKEQEEELDTGDCTEVPDAFDASAWHVRTQLHSVLIFANGDMWLKATSKDSTDYVEAEFHLSYVQEIMKAGFSKGVDAK